MLRDQIVYWLIGRTPIAETVAHPGLLSSAQLLSAIHDRRDSPYAEMSRLLTFEPEIIVTQSSLEYLQDKPELRAVQSLLDAELAKHYRLANVIEDRLIYRRRAP